MLVRVLSKNLHALIKTLRLGVNKASAENATIGRRIKYAETLLSSEHVCCFCTVIIVTETPMLLKLTTKQGCN